MINTNITPYYEKNYLTEREKEVLKYITFTQVKAHVCSVLQKLNIKDRVPAAVIAVTEGLA